MACHPLQVWTQKRCGQVEWVAAVCVAMTTQGEAAWWGRPGAATVGGNTGPGAATGRQVGGVAGKGTGEGGTSTQIGVEESLCCWVGSREERVWPCHACRFAEVLRRHAGYWPVGRVQWVVGVWAAVEEGVWPDKMEERVWPDKMKEGMWPDEMEEGVWPDGTEEGVWPAGMEERMQLSEGR